MRPINRVHIEGMGLTGCLLALCLERLEVKFTWNDTDAEHTAWKASTGAIYPCGKLGSVDWACYRKWRSWLYKLMPKNCWEEADYWFSQKTPPHEGHYDVYNHHDGVRDGLQLAGASSFHLNVQQLVPQVRNKFRDARVDKRHGKVGCTIVAHGFGERLDYAYWGWHRVVDLKINFPHTLRPAFYFREGRYVMAYAYPIPNTPYWYAGSSIIKQKKDKLHPLEILPKYERWKANFERLGGGAVSVARAMGEAQGWRPAYAAWPGGKEQWESSMSWVRRINDGQGRPVVITVPPLWNSGIRHFPKVMEEVVSMLGYNAIIDGVYRS